MTVTISDYFLLSPDWDSPVSQKRIWRTSIQTSIKENEKRSALFTWPRRTLSFMVQCMSVSETNYVRRKLYKNLHNVWGIPLWPEWTQLSSQASSGQAVLNVGSTENRNFEVGGKCMILVDEDNYEAGDILSMTSTSITLDTNLNSTWDSGLYVYPILKAQLKAEQTGVSKSIGFDTFSFEFIEVPDTDITHYLFSVTPDTYNTFNVFETEPNWLSSLNIDYKHNYDVLKFLGARYTNTNVAETNMSLTALFSNFSSTELNDLLGFFDISKGRWDQFWLPSFNEDITITSAFVGTDTTFDIEDIKWSAYWNGMDVVGQYLRFQFPDGSIEYRNIIGAPSATEITIDATIDTAVTTEELPFLKVSFLFLVRFDIDEIEINRETETVSDCKLKFTTIYGAAI